MDRKQITQKNPLANETITQFKITDRTKKLPTLPEYDHFEHHSHNQFRANASNSIAFLFTKEVYIEWCKKVIELLFFLVEPFRKKYSLSGNLYDWDLWSVEEITSKIEECVVSKSAEEFEEYVRKLGADGKKKMLGTREDGGFLGKQLVRFIFVTNTYGKTKTQSMILITHQLAIDGYSFQIFFGMIFLMAYKNLEKGQAIDYKIDLKGYKSEDYKIGLRHFVLNNKMERGPEYWAKQNEIPFLKFAEPSLFYKRIAVPVPKAHLLYPAAKAWGVGGSTFVMYAVMLRLNEEAGGEDITGNIATIHPGRPKHLGIYHTGWASVISIDKYQLPPHPFEEASIRQVLELIDKTRKAIPNQGIDLLACQMSDEGKEVSTQLLDRIGIQVNYLPEYNSKLKAEFWTHPTDMQMGCYDYPVENPKKQTNLFLWRTTLSLVFALMYYSPKNMTERANRIAEILENLINMTGVRDDPEE